MEGVVIDIILFGICADLKEWAKIYSSLNWFEEYLFLLATATLALIKLGAILYVVLGGLWHIARACRTCVKRNYKTDLLEPK